jgi:D-serine deaminase-like pyridoxal phosphate-dependent protein
MPSLDTADTPAVLIDDAVVEANLARAQAHADRHRLGWRPHIKTHKLPHYARRQLALGARGITCQKLGEAEVMADAGIGDIFISYNILGAAKLDRLAALQRRMDRLAVAADNPETVAGYAARFTDAGLPLEVVVECDTGAGRCGVADAEAALALARAIDAAPGLTFAGLMTYPPRGGIGAVSAFFGAAQERLEAAGLPPARLSSGGTPDLWQAGEARPVTEHRAGTYIYNDRMMVAFGHCGLQDCALSVLATVVSRPAADRAILDAGSKALAADLSPAPGMGHIREYPEAVITTLNEEHGIVDLSACDRRPKVGERVRIVPNHVCVVSNLFDAVHILRDGMIVETLPVAARGKVG